MFLRENTTPYTNLASSSKGSRPSSWLVAFCELDTSCREGTDLETFGKRVSPGLLWLGEVVVVVFEDRLDWKKLEAAVEAVEVEVVVAVAVDDEFEIG